MVTSKPSSNPAAGIFRKIASTNAGFIAFFGFAAYGLHWFVNSSVDAVWNAHNSKVGFHTPTF